MEIELKKNEESGNIEFVCPICMEDITMNIEEIDYENQCTTGIHYTCKECMEKWKNSLFQQHSDYTCVMCKSIIKEYRNEELFTLEEINGLRNRLETNIENRRHNPSSFFYKLMWFEFILLFSSVFVLVNTKPDSNTIRILYIVNVFTGLLTFIVGMTSCSTNGQIHPMRI